MKKLIAILMVTAMCFTVLTACGKEPAKSTITPAETPAAAAEPKAEPTEEPVSEPAEEPAEASENTESVSFGRMEGGVYENSYAGFGVALDNSWTFCSAAELQDVPETVSETVFEGTELEGFAEKYPLITDMMAENAESCCTMNVLYTKLDVQSRLAGRMSTEQELLEATLAQKDMMMDSYAQAGIAVEDMSIEEISFLGEPHKAMLTTAEVQGVPYYILQVLDYSRGAYGITLTVSSYMDNNTQEILNLFYSLG